MAVNPKLICFALALVTLLACSLDVSTALAQPPRGVVNVGSAPDLLETPPTALLIFPVIRKELGLDREQEQKIAAAFQKQRAASAAAQALFSQNANKNKDISAIAAEMQEIAEKGRINEQELGDLLNEEQSKRLRELHLQRHGIKLIARPDVANELGLTAQQQQEALRLTREGMPQGSGVFNTPEDARKEAEKYRAWRATMESNLRALLSEEQQQKWTEMQGKPFDFAKTKPKRFGS